RRSRLGNRNGRKHAAEPAYKLLVILFLSQFQALLDPREVQNGLVDDDRLAERGRGDRAGGVLRDTQQQDEWNAPVVESGEVDGGNPSQAVERLRIDRS